MTGDDELIERLRRTLRAEAAAITPGRGASRFAAPAGRGGGTRRRGSRRRYVVLSGAVAVAAAAAVLAALALPGQPRRQGVFVGPGGRGSSSVGNTTTSTNAATTPTNAPATPTTAGNLPASAAPAGFEPLSVTFVTSNLGWVAGTAPCGNRLCVALERTTDGGYTWSEAPAPLPEVSFPATDASAIAGGAAGLLVRFANGRDGWIVVTSPVTSVIFATHDGGAHWGRVALQGFTSGDKISDLEASGGRVFAVWDEPGVGVEVAGSLDSRDAWKTTTLAVPIGAGPVPVTQLVLQKSAGWILQVNRTVVGGASVDPAGRWSSWPPPCTGANGPAYLAASSPADSVAVCGVGQWGPPSSPPPGWTPNSRWLYASRDGGASFAPVAQLPGGVEGTVVTTASPETIVASSVYGLSASFDGGHSWHVVYSGGTVTYAGFTSETQGVAIATMPSAQSASGSGRSAVSSSATLLMTHDGGRTWTPVLFGASS